MLSTLAYRSRLVNSRQGICVFDSVSFEKVFENEKVLFFLVKDNFVIFMLT